MKQFRSLSMAVGGALVLSSVTNSLLAQELLPKPDPAFHGKHTPYTKGNFEFERVLTNWRGIPSVLDLRLKR
jgi:hypothetical protein